MMQIFTGQGLVTIIIGSLLSASLAVGEPITSGFNPEVLSPDLKWVSIQDIPIVYTDQGKGDPLVILSPYPFSTKLWEGLAQQLSAFARVIVVEPPGLRAPSSMGEDFSSEHLLQIYRKFVKKLGLRKVHILGVGESGALAVAFGHHFPENTVSVVSINGFESLTWSKRIEGTLNHFEQSTEGGLGTLLSIGAVKYRKQPPSSEEVAGLLVPFSEEQHKSAVHSRFQAYTDDIRFGYVLAMLPYVDRPLLLLRPEGDELLPDEYIKRTRTQIRKVRVRYHVISQAGHFIFLDQPQKVAELIQTFLSDYTISK
jgi:pimeloyl-ACP methyl ester carboxylesterase